VSWNSLLVGFAAPQLVNIFANNLHHGIGWNGPMLCRLFLSCSCDSYASYIVQYLLLGLELKV
jgi:hypothetical protein